MSDFPRLIPRVAALALLPVAALRLPPEAVHGLRRLGIDLVGQLASTPRAALARRFGAAVLQVTMG